MNSRLEYQSVRHLVWDPHQVMDYQEMVTIAIDDFIWRKLYRSVRPNVVVVIRHGLEPYIEDLIES